MVTTVLALAGAVFLTLLVVAIIVVGVIFFRRWLTDARFQHKDYPDGTALQAQTSWVMPIPAPTPISATRSATRDPAPDAAGVRDLPGSAPRPERRAMAPLRVRDKTDRTTVH